MPKDHLASPYAERIEAADLSGLRLLDYFSYRNLIEVV